MTREQAKRLEKEIAHWANGGDLWYWSDLHKSWRRDTNKELSFNEKELYNYVIEDKHFEARKAFALGDPIQHYSHATMGMGEWVDTDEIVVTYRYYRPKPKEWHDTVSEENPVLCWCSGKRVKKLPTLIFKYGDGLFYDTDGFRWDNAEPVKPEECWIRDE